MIIDTTDAASKAVKLLYGVVNNIVTQVCLPLTHVYVVEARNYFCGRKNESADLQDMHEADVIAAIAF